MRLLPALSLFFLTPALVSAQGMELSPESADQLDQLLDALHEIHSRDAWCKRDCATFLQARFSGSLKEGQIRITLRGQVRGDQPALVPLFATKPAVDLDELSYASDAGRGSLPVYWTGDRYAISDAGRGSLPVYWTGEHYAVALRPGTFTLTGAFRCRAREQLTLKIPGPVGLVQIDVAGADVVGTGERRGVTNATYRLTPRITERRSGIEEPVSALRMTIDRSFDLGRERSHNVTVTVRGTRPGQVITLPLRPGEKVESWPKDEATVHQSGESPHIDWAPPAKEATLRYGGKWTEGRIALVAPEGAVDETWRVRCDDPYLCRFEGDAEPKPGAIEHVWEPLGGQRLDVTWQELDPLAGAHTVAQTVHIATKADGRNLRQHVEIGWRTSSGALVTVAPPKSAVVSRLELDATAIPILKNDAGALQISLPTGSSKLVVDWQLPGAASRLVRAPIPSLSHPVGTLWHRIYPASGSVVLLSGGLAGSPRVPLWSKLGACLVIALIVLLLFRHADAPLTKTTLWVVTAAGFAILSPVAVVLVGVTLAWGRALGRIHDSRGRFRIALELLSWASLVLAVIVVAVSGLERALLSAHPISIESFVSPPNLAGLGWSGMHLCWGAYLASLPEAGTYLPRAWALCLPLLGVRLVWAVWAVLLAVFLAKEGRLALTHLTRYWERARAPTQADSEPEAERGDEPTQSDPSSK